YFFFGGGATHQSYLAQPRLPDGTLEVAATYEEPIGHVALSSDGRKFFTVHPAANTTGPKLLEWRDGAAVPFPGPEVQAQLETPLGIIVDAKNWLWVLDAGNHGFGQAKLLAFDLADGALVHNHAFARDVVGRGSFLHDLAISADGQWVYIADSGVIAKRAGLIVYSVGGEIARRVLNRHETVAPRKLVIRNPIKQMSFYEGLFELRAGVSGLALNPDGDWLYFAAMNHDSLYRIPTALLNDPRIPHERLAVDIETVGFKPLTDGVAIDAAGTAYVADVEHQSINVYDIEGVQTTLVQDARLRWPDDLTFGPDGYLYIADSGLPHVLLEGAGAVAQHAPYAIWRLDLSGG
ncbi:MAG: L-dopachrome tautomerase-related protein, partial [Pseudomonadota bacterium]